MPPITHDVVYNLTALAEELYVPEAFIVSRDRDGYLTHIRQKALTDTIGSFDLELDPVRSQLFTIIEELRPKALEKRFNPPKQRKPRELPALLEEEDIKAAIVKYVHRRLDAMLTLIARHNLPLTWAMERKVLVKDFLIVPQPDPLEPKLSFQRSDAGVRYRLELGQGDRFWKVSGHEVVPITNHPAWILVDDRLYRGAHFNGNMVKPFRQKDEVVIPQASVRAYFQKFIAKVAARVEIEAEGFEVIYHDELEECRLEAVRDLFSDRWVLAVRMAYPGVEFNWSDPKDKRTTLEFAGEEVRISQVRRNREAESAFIEKLRKVGVDQAAGAYFLPGELDEHPLALPEWLAGNRPKLEASGFTIIDPAWEEGALYLHPCTVQLGASPNNDWFDLYGIVTVGEISFPFLDLARHIREENPFFPLPNGAIFLIPQEWMAKYRGLAQFARREGQRLRLNRNQYTLLEELGLEAGQEEAGGRADDFHPSPNLRAQLRPYQLEGVRWLVHLYRNQLGGCLADDMGLGKTLQTIAALLHAKEQRAETLAAGPAAPAGQLSFFDTVPDADVLRPLNALIVLPASLVFNWEREIRQFAPGLTVYQHIGPRRHTDSRVLARFDVLLTTYQTALRDVDLLGKIEYEYIVLDESHYIKNRESKIFRAINTLRARHKLSLSGTPIENSLSDLWSQMQFINPDLLGQYAFFRREFITPIEKHQDEPKKDQLRKLVAPYLLRRTKDLVAKDLPPLTVQTFYSEMSAEQQKLYEREKSAARNYLLEHFDATSPQYKIMVLQSLTKLRQLANHPVLAFREYERDSGKFQDVLEQWDTVRRSGHKVLFFSFFVQYLELFRAEFEKNGQPYAWLTGDLSSAEREAQVHRFENDPDVQAFFISIKSGGAGLNLTSADYVFLLDPWWNPFTEQQAIARAHRIGQDKHVIALKFITRDSIEEKIMLLQERKSKLAEDVIGEAPGLTFNRGELAYLFE